MSKHRWITAGAVTRVERRLATTITGKRYSIPTACQLSSRPFTGTTGKFATKSTFMGLSCKAKWPRPGWCVATVTTLTAMHWLPRVTRSAHSATSRKRMMPRRIIATSPQVRAAPVLPATCRRKSIWGSTLDVITACEFLDPACRSVPAAPTPVPSAT